MGRDRSLSGKGRTMIRFDEISAIYIRTGATDLRKGIDGYAALVEEEFEGTPFQDALFIFCNRPRDKIKCLYWDGTGFWLLYKRLDKGRFKWKTDAGGGMVSITHQQMRWLLEGLKMEQKKAFENVYPDYA